MTGCLNDGSSTGGTRVAVGQKYYDISRCCPGFVSESTFLIAFDGGTRDGFTDTLFFKPPFGPYPKELKETFPIGPSEIPGVG